MKIKTVIIQVVGMWIFGASIAGATQTPNDGLLPDILVCRVISSVDENGQPRRPRTDVYEITDINGRDGPVFRDDVGVVIVDDDAIGVGMVGLDFGVRAHGGDQYSAFYFKKSDLRKLVRGRAKSVRGVYEVGFEWDRLYLSKDMIKCKSSISKPILYKRVGPEDPIDR